MSEAGVTTEPLKSSQPKDYCWVTFNTTKHAGFLLNKPLRAPYDSCNKER